MLGTRLKESEVSPEIFQKLFLAPDDFRALVSFGIIDREQLRSAAVNLLTINPTPGRLRFKKEDLALFGLAGEEDFTLNSYQQPRLNQTKLGKLCLLLDGLYNAGQVIRGTGELACPGMMRLKYWGCLPDMESEALQSLYRKIIRPEKTGIIAFLPDFVLALPADVILRTSVIRENTPLWEALHQQALISIKEPWVVYAEYNSEGDLSDPRSSGRAVFAKEGYYFPRVPYLTKADYHLEEAAFKGLPDVLPDELPLEEVAL